MAARGQPRPRDGMLAPCENMGHVTERVPMAGRVPHGRTCPPMTGGVPSRAEAALGKGCAPPPGFRGGSAPSPAPSPTARDHKSRDAPRGGWDHVTRMSQWEATKRAANQKGGRGLPGDLNAEGRKWRVSGGRCGARGALGWSCGALRGAVGPRAGLPGLRGALWGRRGAVGFRAATEVATKGCRAAGSARGPERCGAVGSEGAAGLRGVGTDSKEIAGRVARGL